EARRRGVGSEQGGGLLRQDPESGLDRVELGRERFLQVARSGDGLGQAALELQVLLVSLPDGRGRRRVPRLRLEALDLGPQVSLGADRPVEIRVRLDAAQGLAGALWERRRLR